MKQDILNRTEFVDRIVNFVNALSDMNKGACFAIDGKWGSGKSFVLDMIESKLCDIQSEQTADNKFLLAHYNCWQYDYYEEPAVAMVAALLDCIENEETVFNPDIDGKIKAAWSLFKDDIKKMAGKFSENHIGVNVIDVFEKFQNAEKTLIEKNTDYDSMFAFRETMEAARKTLTTIAEEKTIVFVVDELDRCMPSYAIKVLERLHHFFDGIDNVVVMIAVDSTQLNHSVKQIYGEKTDEKAYLKKFITLTFKLDVGEIQNGIYKKYDSYFSMFDLKNQADRQQLEEIFNILWEGTSIRIQERAIEKAVTIHKMCSSEICEPSIALYEIISVRFKNQYGRSLHWIPQINHMTYGGLEQTLSKKTVAYLKEMQKKASTGKEIHNLKGVTFQLSNNMLGKAFYYLYLNYPENTRFSLPEGEENADSITLSKMFAELLKAIES